MIIADEQNELGGWLLGESDVVIDDKPADSWIESVVAALSAMDNVTLLPRTTVFGMAIIISSPCVNVSQIIWGHAQRIYHVNAWKVRAAK